MAEPFSTTTRNHIENSIRDFSAELARCAAFEGMDITTADGRTVSKGAYREELVRNIRELIDIRRRMSPPFIGRMYGRQIR